MVANLARLRACVRVARKTSRVFSRKLFGGGRGGGAFEVRQKRKRQRDRETERERDRERESLRPATEEKDHDQGVREAHLGAVDGAVARALEHREGVMIPWVEDDALNDGLEGETWFSVSLVQSSPSRLPANHDRTHLEGLQGRGHGFQRARGTSLFSCLFSSWEQMSSVSLWMMVGRNQNIRTWLQKECLSRSGRDGVQYSNDLPNLGKDTSARHAGMHGVRSTR